jgi:hypothetical protein
LQALGFVRDGQLNQTFSQSWLKIANLNTVEMSSFDLGRNKKTLRFGAKEEDGGISRQSFPEQVQWVCVFRKWKAPGATGDSYKEPYFLSGEVIHGCVWTRCRIERTERTGAARQMSKIGVESIVPLPQRSKPAFSDVYQNR